MRSCPACHRSFIDTQAACPLDNTSLRDADGVSPVGLGKKLGPYQLIGLLGEGGMGNLYVGRHGSLGRYVAIKTLRAELANRKENVERFFQEAQTINALEHPNIVEALDLVEDPVDGVFCVLELLKGPDLKTRLARGPLSIASAIRVAVQLADALGKVHAIGVVHRDLKPDNVILIERDGRDDFVKLIDFGIAQIGGHGAGVFGTAAYMAPEQGVQGATVDRRADIYSLGVILFEMVCGRHPFPSETDSAYLIAHADTRAPRPSKLSKCPPALEAVILKCMEKAPADRFGSVDQVAAALRMIDPRPSSGGRVAIVAGVVVAALALMAGAFILVPSYQSKPTLSIAAPAEAPAPPTAPSSPPKGVEAAAQQPVAPAFVDISVTSSPVGVSVYRVSETVPLGVTPFTVSLPSSGKAVEMRFEKVGFRSMTVEVPVDDRVQIEVTLSKLRDVARPHPIKIRKGQAAQSATAIAPSIENTSSPSRNRP